MLLQLERSIFSPQATVGNLSIDNHIFCQVLEDVVRLAGQAIVRGRTAIPAGSYEVVISYSTRFQQPMPLLVNVPGGHICFGGQLIDRCGVRIHSGNDQFATVGCLLVGTYDPKKPNWISNSRSVFAKLYPKIEAAAKLGAITLTIK